MSTHDNQVLSVRRFNRFYTRQIGVLDERFLGSGFSLTEGRVLSELAHRGEVSPAELAKDLGLDPGYLSRILKRFQRVGLIGRRASAEDGRRTIVALTDAGRAAFAPLDAESNRQVRTILARIPRTRRGALLAAMRFIEATLAGDETDGAAAPVLRPLRVGDIGWIAHRQGILYAEEYGWDAGYEALVAEILATFVQKFDPDRERAWVAERDGEIVGSVFIVRRPKKVAKLRLLYVESSARGLGLGRRLVDECIVFARGKGYRTMTLWTQSNLAAARKIYEAAGFQLVAKEPHHSFGKYLIGETWELDLR